MAANKSKKIDLKSVKDKKGLFVGKENLILTVVVVLSTLIIFFLWIFVLRISWQNQDESPFIFSDDIKKILDEPVPEFDNSFNFGLPELEEKNENDSRLEKEASNLLEDIIKEADKNVLKPKTDNCPDWINCMPTIGEEMAPCQVPLGCEGVTQIVY